MSKECTTHHHACDCREAKFRKLERENAALRAEVKVTRQNWEDYKSENAALREAKDAYFKHNNILVKLMTEEQKKKALEILMSRPKEAQP